MPAEFALPAGLEALGRAELQRQVERALDDDSRGPVRIGRIVQSAFWSPVITEDHWPIDGPPEPLFVPIEEWMAVAHWQGRPRTHLTIRPPKPERANWISGYSVDATTRAAAIEAIPDGRLLFHGWMTCDVSLDDRMVYPLVGCGEMGVEGPVTHEEYYFATLDLIERKTPDEPDAES